LACWMINNFLIPRSGVDKVFLNRVQEGFGSSGFTWGMEEVALVIGILAAAILIFYLIKIIFRLDKYTIANIHIDRIESPRRIRRIIRRSIDLRAVYDLEVYDKAYQEIYKCMPIGINKTNELEIEISSYLDPNLDFRDKAVRIAFRTSRRGKEEFYHFETKSLYLDFTVIRKLREKSIRLVIPTIVNRGQKRRFVRVEPAGEFGLSVNLIRPTQDGKLVPLKSFKLIGKAMVNDISIGSLNVTMKNRKSNQEFKKNDLIYLHFKLPINDLDIQDIPTNHFIKARVVDFDRSSLNEVHLKLMFVERGTLDQEARAISFSPATWMSFEDLSFWIQAYQRHLLQEESGVKRRPDAVRNIYAPEPLNITPKYPRQSLRQGSAPPTESEG